MRLDVWEILGSCLGRLYSECEEDGREDCVKGAGLNGEKSFCASVYDLCEMARAM